MGRRISIELGSREFTTKLAAATAIRDILNNTQFNKMLIGESHDLIYHLLLQHPHAETKIGRGVASITVGMSDRGGRCFWVNRIDGSRVDFSYQVALNGSRSHRLEILCAMRREVALQVIEFRDRYFAEHSANAPRAPCQLTGALILPSESHVDHIVRFVDLADHFVKQFCGYNNIEYERAETGSASWLRDRNVAQRWSLWHKRHAQLRIVSTRANLTRRYDES